MSEDATSVGRSYELLALLERLNRKERFFLVGRALGNPAFRPTDAFLDEVCRVLALPVPNSRHVHCFMDFHFDWIYAALKVAATGSAGPFDSPAFPAQANKPAFNVNTNQEDVDLLLAWRGLAQHHLVMIEAKADTGWRTEQLESKGRRLRAIFGTPSASQFPDVSPHVLLASPKRPKKVSWKDFFPDWALPDDGRPLWMSLTVKTWDRLRIHRCDPRGEKGETGSHWMMVGLPML